MDDTHPRDMATLSHLTSSLLFQKPENIRNGPNKSSRRLHKDPNYIASNDVLVSRFTNESQFVAMGKLQGLLINPILFVRTWQDGVSEQRSAYANILVRALCKELRMLTDVHVHDGSVSEREPSTMPARDYPPDFDLSVWHWL